MYLLLIAIFVIGYAAIAFEHTINLNKTASALLTGILCWTVLALAPPTPAVQEQETYQEYTEHLESTETAEAVQEELDAHHTYVSYIGFSLREHLGEIAEILFFLIGAMTIVELIDAHEGFRFITDKINTNSPRPLLWLLSILTFFMSALLDNLTTSIVMISLLRRLVTDTRQRMIFAGLIIIAANAGGAWSPIGDVTTTMLWIGGQITTLNIIKGVFIPSVVCLLVPLLMLSFQFRNSSLEDTERATSETPTGSLAMLITGVSALIFVPIFKTVTHLPPWTGMMLGLGVVWVVSEIINKDKDEEERHPYTAVHALSKIDVPSVLFFLGILVAIAALQTAGMLTQLSAYMANTIGNLDLIVYAIGLASAVIDNVPLVAATMGMYDMAAFPPDSKLWEFIAYCAGTGGSVLIIGSAAGVAVMGMEKIDFMWYLRKISLLALAGYTAGALVYLLLYGLAH
ncbi:Na+/H+ antiporter NhaD [Catalinimonas alkaloidigena]|uniref:Na+/H+ antiporter NhaD n=1 Tax=Catalinimonas alkaloidigena TaxID=1075417 RepID=A0A1G8ZQ46_9BACT|nr:sodium:proton antiporter NhaD [Catalinimonas alkaloidigena]SDK17222.1 Na+/H+ antiporter NhaD [Catalinimonas alkaloidigena]